MSDRLYDLTTELREKRTQAKDRWAKFEADRKSAVEAGLLYDDATQKRLDGYVEEYEALDNDVKTLEERFSEEAPKVRHAVTSASPGQFPADISQPGNVPGDQEKAWARGTVSKLIESKALDATSGGTIPAPFFDATFRNLPSRNLFVRSVLPTETANSDKVWYLRQTVRTNNAAPVATAAVKPTSVFSVERLEATVRTVAHLTEAIDRALLNDFAALTNFLSAELHLGVLSAEEDEIINGSGTALRTCGILTPRGLSRRPAEPIPAPTRS